MDSKGDIPDRAEVEPNGDSMLDLFQEILSNGIAHVYLENLPDDEDIHCYQYNTHVFPDVGDDGVIYTQVGDVDTWIDVSSITMVERHYE